MDTPKKQKRGAVVKALWERMERTDRERKAYLAERSVAEGHDYDSIVRGRRESRLSYLEGD